MLLPAFDSFGGTTIHCWSAMPSSAEPAAKILLVHGLGTHNQSLHFRYLRDYLIVLCHMLRTTLPPLTGEGWDGGENIAMHTAYHPHPSPPPSRGREAIFVTQYD
jgi:hypothetical protein